MGKNNTGKVGEFKSHSLYFEIFNTIRIRERRLYSSIITPIFKLGFIQFQEAPLTIIIQKPDAVVIQGINNFDEKIFDYIYKRYFPKVESQIRKKGGNPDLANDIFQDTILDIIEQSKRGKLNITSSIENYIITIAVRKWGKILSKSIKNRELPIEVNEKADDIHPIIDLEPTENFEEVLGWLDELSDSCKTLINEFYFNKKNWDKIASEHGYKNARSASNQKYKCLEPLRIRLDSGKYNI